MLTMFRNSAAALACAGALFAGAAGAGAQANEQDGLINVNLQDVLLEVPVSVALPIGVAANVCDVSVLSIKQGADSTCTAETTNLALSRAIADAVLDTGGGNGGGGGGNNRQSGLVNVNIQELAVQIPVSVAVPIGVAANVCDVSVLALEEDSDSTCDAETTNRALSRALAEALV